MWGKKQIKIVLIKDNNSDHHTRLEKKNQTVLVRRNKTAILLDHENFFYLSVIKKTDRTIFFI
jgi:hypothetical protein